MHATLGGECHRQPLVSVICVYRNAQRFIAEALDSIACQTYRNLEVVLVDDGSDDDSLAIVREWAERQAPHPKLLNHPGNANLGISASRNVGIAAARGDFVAFIDADDVWAAEKIAAQVAILQAHPAVDLVAGSVLYWGSWEGGPDRVVKTGHVQNKLVHPPEASINLYPLGFSPSPCPSDILVRRRALSGVGGFEPAFSGPFSLYEDQCALAKMYLNSVSLFSDAVWTRYRLHADSCSAKVIADGRYGEVRAFFLTWLRSYLRDHPSFAVELASLIDRAEWRLRHPFAARLVSRGSALFRDSRKALSILRS